MVAAAARRRVARRFYKLTGSGNDFVFFDVRADRVEFADDRPASDPWVIDPAAIRALCARGTGVGADGVVFLDAPAPREVAIVYANSDGTRASLCGNATLCTARLAEHLGIVHRGEAFTIRTDVGALRAWVAEDGTPSFELGVVEGLAHDAAEAAADPSRGERRVGFADSGVPHLVVRVADVDSADVAGRGLVLRAPVPARPTGANVNFVGRLADGRWGLRTFERGVEGETLACGTGAVAAAAVLRAWGEADDRVELWTRSGKPLHVELGLASGRPVLAGEGRLVFEGLLAG